MSHRLVLRSYLQRARLLGGSHLNQVSVADVLGDKGIAVQRAHDKTQPGTGMHL
jgi:hypothetical protein